MAHNTNPVNLFVVGAQSTGKTTLVNALEKYFSQSPNHVSGVSSTGKPAIVREVARNVLKEHNFTAQDITTSPSRAFQLQQLIQQAQHTAEKTIWNDSSIDWYITDRSGVDPVVYALEYVGKEKAEELLASAEWAELEPRMKSGIVVLCEAGCTWLIDDGTRLMPKDLEEWMKVDMAFRKILEARGIAYLALSKDHIDIDERVKLVTKALNGRSNDE